MKGGIGVNWRCRLRGWVDSSSRPYAFVARQVYILSGTMSILRLVRALTHTPPISRAE